MNKVDIEIAKTNTVKTYLQGITHNHSIQELCDSQDTARFHMMFKERLYEIVNYAFKAKSKCSTAYWPVVDFIRNNNKLIISNKHADTNFTFYESTFPVHIKTSDYKSQNEESDYFLDVTAVVNRNTIDDTQCAVAIYEALVEMLRKGMSKTTDKSLLEFAKGKRFSENPVDKTLANIITLSNNSYQDKLASFLSDIIYINFENDNLKACWKDNIAYTELIKLYNIYNNFHKYTKEELNDHITEYEGFGLDYNKFCEILNTGISELESKLGIALSECQDNAWNNHGICIRAYIWIPDYTV